MRNGIRREPAASSAGGVTQPRAPNPSIGEGGRVRLREEECDRPALVQTARHGEAREERVEEPNFVDLTDGGSAAAGLCSGRCTEPSPSAAAAG